MTSPQQLREQAADLIKQAEKLESEIWPRSGDTCFMPETTGVINADNKWSWNYGEFATFMLSLGLVQKTPEAVQTVLTYLQETVKAAGRVPDRADWWSYIDGTLHVVGDRRIVLTPTFPTEQEAQSYAKAQEAFLRLLRNQ
jgi:hypothetical protein